MPEVVYGRNEAALIAYHQEIERALGAGGDAGNVVSLADR
jgi:hypothetical protein